MECPECGPRDESSLILDPELFDSLERVCVDESLQRLVVMTLFFCIADLPCSLSELGTHHRKT